MQFTSKINLLIKAEQGIFKQSYAPTGVKGSTISTYICNFRKVQKLGTIRKLLEK